MNRELVMMVLEVLIACIAAVCSKYVIPWIKETTTNNRYNQAMMWVKEAVHAMDQCMSTESGEKRKEEVLKFIDKIIEKYQVEITEEEINILIESAVKQLRIEQANKQK